jgi:putative FmdB family regulatory protein
MPTYGYRCEKNGHEFEVFQNINDAPLTRCKICGSRVRRIFYPVGIVFKGPGFYKTDSRAAVSAGTPSARNEKEKAEKPAEVGEKPAEVKKAEPKADSKKTKSEPPAKKTA